MVLLGRGIFLLITFSAFLSSVPQTFAKNSRGIKISISDEKGAQVALYKESHALLIAVSDYTNGWPDLPGVEKDLVDVKRALENNGFTVTVVHNPKKQELMSAMDEFIAEHGYAPDNRLLIYYAGHGYTLKQSYGGEMGYIVPVDTPRPDNNRQGFLQKAIDMQQVEVYAKRIQSKHVLFMFDSCFSGSIFALSRAAPSAINYKTARPVRQFITSGSANEEVPDKSIFKEQFLAALDGEGDLNGDGYLTGSELGMFLEDRVINYSRESQHPQYGKIRDPNLDKGDFIFVLLVPEQLKQKGIVFDKSKKLPEPKEIIYKRSQTLISPFWQLDNFPQDLSDKIIDHAGSLFKNSARLKAGCGELNNCLRIAKNKGYTRLALVKFKKEIEQSSRGVYKGTLNVEIILYEVQSKKIVNGPVKTYSQIVGWTEDTLDWNLAADKIIKSNKLALVNDNSTKETKQ